ncbi:MAG: response regulator [Betaproteobacteria bacterium]|nr:response regulator [Betaproteobacteria bacterium]
MKTVFCIDNSSTILLSLGTILGKAGYGIEKAVNGEEALSKLKGKVKPDLIITDLNMSGMNGIELIKQVRILPRFKFVPILFLTTESRQEKRAEARAAGASGWLVKPVHSDELLNTVKLAVR